MRTRNLDVFKPLFKRRPESTTLGLLTVRAGPPHLPRKPAAVSPGKSPAAPVCPDLFQSAGFPSGSLPRGRNPGGAERRQRHGIHHPEADGTKQKFGLPTILQGKPAARLESRAYLGGRHHLIARRLPEGSRRGRLG